ncbi:hypothetical protein [Actinospica robiniae]|uniref:hypothetical protein n=1 Tax=Actinospica robiniae TaxID=304901 RepID=UPI000555F0FC|nr:hypothetical protein [Actinospica robiniae]
MSWTPLTEDDYARTVSDLRGRCITGVTYYPLARGDERTEVEDWDFGDWHLPTMGVELLVDSSTRFSAVWGHSFDYHGLEIYPGPVSAHLGMIGQPGGTPQAPVTGHPAWSGIIDTPLVGIEVHWSEGAYGRRLPLAVALSTQTCTTWLVAGAPARWPADGRFHLGTDDAMVVFTRTLAIAIGLTPEPQ